MSTPSTVFNEESINNRLYCRITVSIKYNSSLRYISEEAELNWKTSLMKTLN